MAVLMLSEFWKVHLCQNQIPHTTVPFTDLKNVEKHPLVWWVNPHLELTLAFTPK